MFVSMLILLVRTHTLRTTIIEHQRVGILNSPENLPGKMQWNKLLTIFLPWHLFFLICIVPSLICWLIKMLFLVLHLCGLKKYVIELIYRVSCCTSVTFSENIIPEKSINTTHQPRNVLHTWHAREWKKPTKCKKWSIQRSQSELQSYRLWQNLEFH